MSLIEVKIENVCDVGDGAHASIKRKESGVPYLTSKNFKIDGLDLSKLDFISQEDFEKFFKSKSKAITKPQANDILLSIIGSIGSPYLVKNNEEFGLSSSVSILRPFDDKILPIYLYYWLKSDLFQKSIQKIKSGVAQSFLSLGMIRSLPVIYIESLPTQKKIASILSVYDDLIENNLKRIQLLEETAQRIYKEWFVDFKFPNHENTPINEETGLPEGWEKIRADEIFKINIGKTPPRKEPEWFSRKEGVKWVSISDMNKASTYVFKTKERITFDGVKKFNVKVVPQNTVLLSFKLTVGAVKITTEDMVTNEAIAHFNIDKNTPSTEFTYMFLKSFNYQSLGSTSSIGTALNSKIVKSIPFLIVSEKTEDKFTKSIKNIFGQINSLLQQNQTLKEARDLLLPRLMNRTLEV
ncbi:restriction endonuclease subunit S [Winogradskyella sp. SM1960]|uniref:restriction endonuclease subunit S n=1 Tax=Winogradskyella sp. SM1960 TaxID=2865955 RepID=UPI001CD5C169|nr:restriction endonuclease subunit S [Winogradskyella sp. SM1960]